MDRDLQLDAYRGMSMLYIVCFVHVLYWLQLGTEPYLSICLVEMPIIFFIAGASQSFRVKTRPIKATFVNRIKRVVIPYYKYAFVMLLMLLVLSVFGKADISAYSPKDSLKILLFYDIPQLPFMWHLWFILPYLFISCTFDFQKRILNNMNHEVYLLICCLAFGLAQYLSANQMIRNVLVYNIFMVIGYCYYRKVKKRQLIIGEIAFFMVLLLLKSVGVHFAPMQAHKFPADMVFLIYNLFALCVLSLIFGKIYIKSNKVLNFWTKNGFDLYLYQNVSYMIVAFLLRRSFIQIPYVGGQMFVCMISVFVVSMLVVMFINLLEKKAKQAFAIIKKYGK